VEHQTEEGVAQRHRLLTSAREFTGVDTKPELHKEQLEFDYVHLAQRSYK
jgi:succinate dehydrogenase / fumarate reductase flavoprotein subunit